MKQLIVTRHPNGKYSCFSLAEPMQIPSSQKQFDCSEGDQCQKIGGLVWSEIQMAPELPEK